MWDFDSSTGLIKFPKGNIWNTIGVIDGGKARVFVDEALYLIEFHSFEILDTSSPSEFPVNSKSLSGIFKIANNDCGLLTYKV